MTHQLKDLQLTDQEKRTLTLALDSFFRMCQDEVLEKQDIPGEQRAVAEDKEHLSAITSLLQKFSL